MWIQTSTSILQFNKTCNQVTNLGAGSNRQEWQSGLRAKNLLCTGLFWLLLARPSSGHGLIGEQSEIFIFSVWPRVDVTNNCAHPLQIVGVLGRAK